MFDQLLANSLFQRYVIEGGPVMYALVPLSLIMLGAVLQGAIRLRSARVMPARLIKQARAVDAAGRRQFLRELADDPSPLGRVVWLTLKDHLRQEELPPWEELAPELAEATAEVSDEMHDGIGLLGTIYTVAPLLGLLGTILGMMNAFYRFAQVAAEQTVARLSEGIEQALVTTMWGLAIAIPAFVAAQALQGWIRRYERIHLPKAAQRLIESIYRPTAGEAADEPAAAATEAES